MEKIRTAITASPDDRALRVWALDEDYKFHQDLIDFQGNGIIGKHYRLNAARWILDACLADDADSAASLLAQHVEISREHTLGLRPMRWKGKPATLTHRPARDPAQESRVSRARAAGISRPAAR